jgi:uncharacterized protein RhaS with RHS repeats
MSKTKPEDILREKTSILMQRQHEADDMVEATEQDHQQQFSKFRVERSNVVKAMNTEKQTQTKAAQDRFNSAVQAAVAKAEAMVAEAKKLAAVDLETTKAKLSADFNAKAKAEADKFDADLAVLRSKLTKEAEAAARTRRQNIEPLEKEIAALEAEIAAAKTEVPAAVEAAAIKKEDAASAAA